MIICASLIYGIYLAGIGYEYGFVIALIGAAIPVFASICFYEIAKMKGYDQIKYLIIPLVLDIIGYLIIIALPDRGSIK